ncbi:MAG: type II toxin-antitoxin system HipA family toxin [Gammaproteobacteria bacterium]|nr:type II toxin-antitoxin system HipA family toxin [Gammaproteobacteria bacterium]
MNGHKVGNLKRSASGALTFRYDETWLSTPAARPISRSMPLSNKAYAKEAYNFFDNLLPDSPRIRERIQGRFHADTNHPYDLLAAIGQDCVGAVQLSPLDIEPKDIHHIHHITGIPLSDTEIAHTLQNYKIEPLGMRGEDDEDFRISIAGAQEKTALLWHENRWMRPSGTTPTTHILKLPIGMTPETQMDLTDSCENEWLCLKIAKAYGLDVCQADVNIFDGSKALVVERFDRRFDDDWIMRLPQEDMCQALGIAAGSKYERDNGPGIIQIMELLVNSEESQRDRTNFLRSQILFWLLAAIDGHGKNFSIFINPHGRYKMTPFYDIMSAYPLLTSRQLETQKIKMAMAVSGQNRHYHWHNILPRHFVSTAKKAKFSQKMAQEVVDETLDRVEEVIDLVSHKVPDTFPDRVITPIFEGMRRLRDRFSDRAVLL